MELEREAVLLAAQLIGGAVICKFASEDTKVPTRLCFETSGLSVVVKVRKCGRTMHRGCSGKQNGKKTIYSCLGCLHEKV